MGVGGFCPYLHVCTHAHYSRAGWYQCDISSFSVSYVRFSFLWCPPSSPPVCLVIADDCVDPPLRPSVIYIVTYCICLCVACCRGVRVRPLRPRTRRVRRVRRAAAGGVSGAALRCRCALPVCPRLCTPVLFSAFSVPHTLQHCLYTHQSPLLPSLLLAYLSASPCYGRRQPRPARPILAGCSRLVMCGCTSMLPPPLAGRHCRRRPQAAPCELG